jgi:hypothetical protein
VEGSDVSDGGSEASSGAVDDSAQKATDTAETDAPKVPERTDSSNSSEHPGQDPNTKVGGEVNSGAVVGSEQNATGTPEGDTTKVSENSDSANLPQRSERSANAAADAKTANADAEANANRTAWQQVSSAVKDAVSVAAVAAPLVFGAPDTSSAASFEATREVSAFRDNAASQATTREAGISAAHRDAPVIPSADKDGGKSLGQTDTGTYAESSNFKPATAETLAQLDSLSDTMSDMGEGDDDGAIESNADISYANYEAYEGGWALSEADAKTVLREEEDKAVRAAIEDLAELQTDINEAEESDRESRTKKRRRSNRTDTPGADDEDIQE